MTYTISKIKRRSDNKIFNCYFRNGNVTREKSSKKSLWISDDDEEIYLYGIDENEFDILFIIDKP